MHQPTSELPQATGSLPLGEATSQADRRIDEFLVMLAHELRNPLAPISNALHLLQMHSHDRNIIVNVREIMDRQIRRLSSIVDNLIDSSRIVRDRIELNRQPLDVVDLIRRCLDERRSAFAAAGVELSGHLPDRPVWVLGDAARLLQTFDLLLQNACKYAGRGGTVTVKLAHESGQRTAAVSVTDSRTGIAPAVLPDGLNAAAQADTAFDRVGVVMGLGMTLVKRLVAMHGGSLDAEVAGVGHGASCIVRLPITEERSLAKSSPPIPVQKVLRRVLIIEDNRDSAESLAILLETYGYQVNLAFTGDEGLQAARENHPEIVICDIGLPGTDGFDVARALRDQESTAKSRIIALSGYGGEEFRRRAFAAGFDRHLVKPADPIQLLAEMESI